MSYFGQQLKMHRKAAQLTQEQVADKAGLVRTSYVRVENSGGAGEDIMRKISEGLGIPYKTLEVWKEIDNLGVEEFRSRVQKLPQKEREYTINQLYQALDPDLLLNIIVDDLGIEQVQESLMKISNHSAGLKQA